MLSYKEFIQEGSVEGFVRVLATGATRLALGNGRRRTQATSKPRSSSQVSNDKPTKDSTQKKDTVLHTSGSSGTDFDKRTVERREREREYHKPGGEKEQAIKSQNQGRLQNKIDNVGSMSTSQGNKLSPNRGAQPIKQGEIENSPRWKPTRYAHQDDNTKMNSLAKDIEGHRKGTTAHKEALKKFKDFKPRGRSNAQHLDSD